MKYLFRVFVAISYVFLSVIIFTIFVLISLVWHLKPFKLIEDMGDRSFMDEIDNEVNNVYKILHGNYKIGDEN